MGKLATGIWLVVSLLLMGVGISLLAVFPSFIRYRVGKEMSVGENHDALKRWMTPPVPIYMKCYFFNLTNEEEFLNGSKPQLQEVGPYVYREQRIKSILSWGDENGTVRYLERKTFEFVANLSNGQEKDKIHTLNIPLVVIPQVFSALIRTFLRTAKVSTLIRKYDVRELLFGTFVVSTDKNVEATIKKSASFAMLDDTVNNYEMYTGVKDTSRMNKLASWNNLRKLKTWKDEYCDMINGTDGSQMPPDVHKEDKLYLFVNEFCRSIYMTYDRDETVEGIDGYRFTIPDVVFESPFKEISNKCFCPKNSSECERKGVLQLDKCRKGRPPISISSPHFYNAHESFLEAVEGLHPNREEHETYLVTEGLTGTILRVHRRIQANLRMKPEAKVEVLKNVNETMFPLIWLDETVEVDEAASKMFKDQVYAPQRIAKIVLGSLVGVGAMIFITVVSITCINKKKGKSGMMKLSN